MIDYASSVTALRAKLLSLLVFRWLRAFPRMHAQCVRVRVCAGLCACMRERARNRVTHVTTRVVGVSMPVTRAFSPVTHTL